MGTKHDSRFIERWLNRIVKDVIGSSKFGIDITRDVSTHLRFGLLHMFHLYALCRNADHAIANAFHFGIEYFIENWKDNHDELKCWKLLKTVREQSLNLSRYKERKSETSDVYGTN